MIYNWTYCIHPLFLTMDIKTFQNMGGPCLWHHVELLPTLLTKFRPFIWEKDQVSFLDRSLLRVYQLTLQI